MIVQPGLPLPVAPTRLTTPVDGLTMNAPVKSYVTPPDVTVKLRRSPPGSVVLPVTVNPEVAPLNSDTVMAPEELIEKPSAPAIAPLPDPTKEAPNGLAGTVVDQLNAPDVKEASNALVPA